MKAEVEIIRSLRWDGFLTFTFRNPMPCQKHQEWCLKRFLRWCAMMRGVHFMELLFLTRFELGELGDREHYHGLISFKTGPAHISFYASASHYWRDLAGFAKFRQFNPQLDGVGYVLDGLDPSGSTTTGANKYEVMKFGRAETYVPQSVNRVVLAAQRRSGFWCHRCGTQKAVCTCSARKLAKADISAVMRGQKLGAVQSAELGRVSGYVESAFETSTADVLRIVKSETF